MQFELIDLGASRSILEDDDLRRRVRPGADVTVIVGGDPRAIACALMDIDASTKRAVSVELGTECLSFHTGENPAFKANVLGFARFRLGREPAAQLVELVRQRDTTPAALAVASSIFEVDGLAVSVCSDVPGRIVDSLLRPYLNAALNSVDEGLAEPEELDRALRLGLGYPRGPVALLEESGLVAHYEVSIELFEQIGAHEFVPACRARVAAMRKRAGLGQELNP